MGDLNLGGEPPELVHELRTYQIELELQNEELRHAHLRLSESLESALDLYEFAPVGYLTLDANSQILRANLTAARLLGADTSHLLYRRFTDFILAADQDIYDLSCRGLVDANSKQTCDLRLNPNAAVECWVQLELVPARAKDGKTAETRVTLSEITQRKRAEAIAEERSSQLRAVRVRLAEAESAERARLARELHDRVGSSLTSLGLRLSRLSEIVDGPAGGLLETCRDLVEEVTAQVRGVLTDLRPPMLDSLGLASALRVEQRRLFQDTNIDIQMLGRLSARLPSNVEVNMLMIAREAMNNVIRHSGASHLTLLLRESERKVEMTVKDDGSGFDSSGARSGWGLSTMSERAHSIGAELEVVSQVGEGTTVTFRLASPPDRP
jgi:signal transduction histidine kinase